MPALRCPLCGCEVLDLIQPKTLAAPQSMDKSDAEVVSCHCTESHRFVVSLHEHVLAEAGTSERSLRLLTEGTVYARAIQNDRDSHPRAGPAAR